MGFTILSYVNSLFLMSIMAAWLLSSSVVSALALTVSVYRVHIILRSRFLPRYLADSAGCNCFPFNIMGRNSILVINIITHQWLGSQIRSGCKPKAAGSTSSVVGPSLPGYNGKPLRALVLCYSCRRHSAFPLEVISNIKFYFAAQDCFLFW